MTAGIMDGPLTDNPRVVALGSTDSNEIPSDYSDFQDMPWPVRMHSFRSQHQLIQQIPLGTMETSTSDPKR